MTRSDNKEPTRIAVNGDKDEPTSILPSESILTDPGPTTDHDSRKTMLRAERRDIIKIIEIERRFDGTDIPDQYTVVQRSETYFGPELLLAANDRNFLLTAPGPDTHLLLWTDRVTDQEYRTNWARSAEVRVTIDETPQYEVCNQCGYPIRSEEHERLSVIGRCPDGS